MSKPRKRIELAQTETVDELPKACADEAAAVEFLERQRWGNTPCCVHCGSVEVYKMTDRVTGERNRRFLWRCRDCKKQYTVRVGTVFSDSPIPLHQWAHAFWMAAASKNGVSALELSRRLQITYKSALFMAHRIRHAMATNHPTPPKLTGTVEADETYVGGKPRYRGAKRGRRANSPHVPVFAVVQRGGHVRANVMATVTAENLKDALVANVDPEADLVTDQHNMYRRIGRPFKSHRRIMHDLKVYVDPDDPTLHTNTVEGFFSRLKRQIGGTYHAVSPRHLHRYVAHAEFLYNTRRMNDGERIVHLIRSADGKRLIYREAKAG